MLASTVLFLNPFYPSFPFRCIRSSSRPLGIFRLAPPIGLHVIVPLQTKEAKELNPPPLRQQNRPRLLAAQNRVLGCPCLHALDVLGLLNDPLADMGTLFFNGEQKQVGDGKQNGRRDCCFYYQRASREIGVKSSGRDALILCPC